MEKRIITIASFFVGTFTLLVAIIHIYYLYNGIDFPVGGLYWWPVFYFATITTAHMDLRLLYQISAFFIVTGAFTGPVFSSLGFIILVLCSIRNLANRE